ncbi:cell wall metabolism sensor histidine kinase WalK [Eubacteriales bacterium OttesenSCG-928-K08]|nr:cell wall metabolism sensor histidine kinase WalK [Eubacteriales bacterium OttesenSCG-928-K08]
MRSIFFWRIIVILVVTVLLASLLMTGGYMYFSRDAYTAIKLNEMVPEAEAISQLYIEHAQNKVTDEAFLRMIEKLMLASNTTGIIIDKNTNEIYNSIVFSEFREQNYSSVIQKDLQGALEGHSTRKTDILLTDANAALSVCLPIRYEGEILGGVYLLKSPTEIKSTTNRLNNSLVLAMAIVLPVMLLLSTFGARQVTEPLRKMGEVALQMSQGDFKVRADETEIGEVGLLARALNNLCDTLSQMIQQLSAEKSQLKAIMASFSEGVAATDSEGFLTHYNPALMRMFGSVRAGSRSELISDEAVWAAFDEVYTTREPQIMHYPMQNDRMIWITLSPILTDAEKECIGVVGLFKDMTEVENQERSRKEYIQNISHELRTPLTAMRGLLEPLSDGMVTQEEDRQRYYKIMMREVLRLSRLITDMMQLSRLQAGTEYMEFAEVDIVEVLEDIHINYQKECAQRGINLELDAPPMPHVITDPDRVEQVIIILLSNAMRYTPEGGTITIRAENMARVNISVSDTGTGIDPKDLEHIFERFYTVDKSRKEGTTGLGLSIAQHIIEKLNEKIIVQSVQGEGSCFTFTLKKYVSNAIALGPAHENWDGIPTDQEFLQLMNEEIVQDEQDAFYEQLPPDEGKKKPRKKPK